MSMSAGENHTTHAGERLHLALAAAFGALCLAGMATTAFRSFSAGTALAAGLITAVVCWRRRENAPKGELRIGAIAGVLAIAATACWFRLPAPLNTIGGFDPGLYSVMAVNIARTGDLEVTDTMHAGLTPELRALYEQNLAAGIAWTDKAQSRYITPYYPMTSVWLAVFIRLAGPDAASWGLTAAGLLVVMGLGMCAREIAGGRASAGWVAAALAAVNPGFAHFSRFPLSEGLALALTTNAAALLFRAWRRAGAGQSCGAELAGSALLFASFFFARMTGLFYLPFVVAAVLLALPARPQVRKGPWFGFLAVLVAAWCASTAFYAWRMQPLFGPIMRFMLSPLEGHLGLVLTAGGAALAAGLWLYTRRPAWIGAVATLAARLAPWAMPAAVALAFWPVYVGWKAGGMTATTEYPFEAVRGQALFIRTLPWRLALYLTPWLLLLVTAAPLQRRRTSAGGLPALLLFTAYMMLLTVASPYGFLRGPAFYMDRYYLSELVPCGLVLAAVLCMPPAGAPRWRLLFGGGLAAAAVVLLGWAASPQRTIPVGDASAFVAEVRQSVRSDDLLVYVVDQASPNGPNRHVLQTPLAYWAGLRVFPVDRANLLRPAVQKLAAAAPRAYVLATETLGSREAGAGIRLERAVRYDLAVPFTPAELGRLRGTKMKPMQEWLDYPMTRARTRGQMHLHAWQPAAAHGADTP